MKTPADYVDKYFAILCYFGAMYLLWGLRGLGVGLFVFALGYGFSKIIEHS